MTIDEAIKYIQYDIYNFDSEDKKQIAEWLEELKAIKENEFYNNAIDEFAEKIKECATENMCMAYEKGRSDVLNWLKRKRYLMCDLRGDYYYADEIAEQLKENKNEY